jgi:Fe-S cluster biogenesis protein NfuA
LQSKIRSESLRELLLYAIRGLESVEDAQIQDEHLIVRHNNRAQIEALLSEWDCDVDDHTDVGLCTENSIVRDWYEGDRTTQKRCGEHDNAEDIVVTRIKHVIQHSIRPVVAGDGGSVEFLDWKDGIAYLQVGNACATCPQSTLSLRERIEQLVKFRVPEVRGVILI